MLDRYHLLVAHHPIRIIEAEYIYYCRIYYCLYRGIAGIKPEDLSPLLIQGVYAMLAGSEGLQDLKQCSKNEELCSKLE